MAPNAPDFAARRFKSAAAHYLAGRPPYPTALIRRTAQLLELRDCDRLLDLGCGPAQLAIAFAPLVREVVAMDPEAEMLALAREGSAGLPNVKVVAGSSTDLGIQLGSFRAALIGRAFHWMDRVETLRRLEDLITPDGAVVLFGTVGIAVPTNTWGQAYRDILRRYAEGYDKCRPPRSEDMQAHVPIFLDSAFSQVEQISVFWQWRFGPELLINQALSMSSTSRARLGERADEMVAELRASIPAWSQDGAFTEIQASNALIARRPAAGDGPVKDDHINVS